MTNLCYQTKYYSSNTAIYFYLFFVNSHIYFDLLPLYHAFLDPPTHTNRKDAYNRYDGSSKKKKKTVYCKERVFGQLVWLGSARHAFGPRTVTLHKKGSDSKRGPKMKTVAFGAHKPSSPLWQSPLRTITILDPTP